MVELGMFQHSNGVGMKIIGIRYLYPVLAAGLLLTALTVYTAVGLLFEQARITSVLRENVSSRAAAADFRGTLNTLVALELHQVESVSELHSKALTQISTIQRFADHSEELRLVQKIVDGFAAYLNMWENAVATPEPERKENQALAIKFLQTSVLLPVREIEGYNDKQIETVTSAHERVLSQLAWGVASVSLLGGIAGVLFGYTVARLLTRSIHKLRIQIHDAAGKLSPETPDVLVQENEGFSGLHEALEDLDERIVATIRQLHDRETQMVRSEQLASLGKLAAGVGHELRNPLTSVKMLVQTGLEEDGILSRSDLKIIEAEVRRMERSLQTFLAFARLPKPERKRVELNDVLECTLDLIGGRAKRQHVVISTETINGDIEFVVDKAQLQQVLVNLAINALDAMPNGGSLTIRTQLVSDGVRIDVVDNGVGFSDEALANLFQAFSSSKEMGVGLGLVICRRIIEEHGGAISAEHTPGGGATFTIWLPVGL
jgi:two-component system, NtrC family, sensor histidine kinase HydH